MLKTCIRSTLAGGTAMLTVMGLGTEVRAQTPAAPAATGGLEEVTVTARRQEESLQQTPVAVTAITAATLDELNMQDVGRLGEMTPNLFIAEQTSSLSAAAIYIRGIGQNEPAAVAEAGVGIYLDGVYVARTAGAIFDFVDLERIEVLRGPQGTLFGRNTTGGAVQLVSRKPSDEVGAEVRAGYGSYNDWYMRGRVDTGVIGESPFKATVAYLHRERDGYFDNMLASDSQDPGSLNNDSFWLAVHGDFTDKFSADLTFDYGERRGTPVFFQLVAATDDLRSYYGASPNFGGAPFMVTEQRQDEGLQAPFDGRFHSQNTVLGTALTLQYDLNDAITLKSITAYREFEQDVICNLSGNGVMRGLVLDPVTFQFAGVQDLNGPYNCHNAPQDQDQTSQELQLLGGAGQWKYVLGLFYFEESASEYNNQRLTFVLPPSPFGQFGLNLAPLSNFGGDTESQAIFGQVSYTPGFLDERMELTVGGRYTRDEKTFFSAAYPEKGDEEFSNTSWLLSANYQFTDDMMAYARASTGYKAGGFSPRSATLSSFDPEEALAYELGLKAEWLDNRVRSNIALFHTTYDDLQVSQFRANTAGAAADIVNAGEATFQGVEIELTAAVTDSLTMNASWGYTDPEYEEYLYRDPVTNQIIDVSDEARFPQLAEHNWQVGAEYAFPAFTFGQLNVRVDYAESTERYMFPLDRDTPFNEEIHDPGRKNLSARISLADMPLADYGTWKVGVWGDNLTDHDNVGDGIDFGSLGFAGKYWLEETRYGIDFQLNF